MTVDCCYAVITTSYLEYSMILLTSANERCRLVGSTKVSHDHLSNPDQARRPSLRPKIFTAYYIMFSLPKQLLSVLDRWNSLG